VLGRTSHILGAQHEFPVTTGAFQTTSESDVVEFIAKYAPDATLVYATFLGPTSGQLGTSFLGDLGVDANGDAYVFMITDSDKMPVTKNAYQPTFGGGFADGYIAKLDPTGAQLLYGSYLGGSADEQGDGERVSIAVDDDGDAYVAGQTFSN